MADQTAINGTQRRLRVVLGALICAVGGGSVWLVRGCAAADPDVPRRAVAPAPPAVVTAPVVDVPEFRKPEEAKRFFDATIDGQRRALAVLEQALRESADAPARDPAYLDQLKQDQARRLAILRAYEDARSKLPVPGSGE